MTRLDLVVRGERVLTDGAMSAREVGVRDGRVVAVEPLGSALEAERVVELAADEVLIPGLVDTHVHVNEPGRTAWEGFASATRAAARGGVTTIVDMPLNSIPPTTSVPALAEKIAATEGKRHVDVAFWGGAVPGSTGQIRALHEAGVLGFKCFLLPSGVPEFGHLDVDELEVDLRELAALDALMVVHAEDARTIDEAPVAHGRGYPGFLRSRPREAEHRAIADVIERARRTGARVHVLHLSSADALPMIAAARADGVAITVETCPHYLALSAEQIEDGATAFKCCPPIREERNRELLWRGLREGTIDCVASDHSPSTADLKHLDDGDFGAAWGGIASLQLALPVVWTAARARGCTLAQVVAWMATRTAALVRLADKGEIAVGRAADLVVLAPEESFVVDPEDLEHRNAVTPYAGATLHGVVRRTLLAGVDVDLDRPSGRLILGG